MVFGLRDGLGEEFYRNIDKQSCLDAGLIVDPATERWWAQQPPAAQDALLTDPRPLDEVARDFSHWSRALNVEYVWSQGANFDGVLWEAASLAVGRTAPWKFFNTRDTRTVYHVCGFDPFSVPRAGIHHSALDDAKHQALLVQRAIKGAVARSEKIAGAVS